MADFITNFSKLSFADISKADDSHFADLTNEQKALSSQFQTLSARLDEPESLESLNSNLRTKTFVAGNVASKADLVVFEKVLPVASKWTAVEDLAKYRHIIRWVDLIQNTLVEVPEGDKLKVNNDVELPREVKEKKKPAAAAGAETGEKKDKKKEAATSAAAPAQEAANASAGKGPISEEEKAARAEAAKAKKAAKAKAKAEQNAKQAAAVVPPNPSMIDFRVGFIQKAERHPNADSLYMSTIDMGDEEGPRIVCSGLVNYMPIEDLQQRYVVVVANLKPVTMRGVKSCAMVLCASTEGKVEFVNPPAGSKAGEKIFFEGFNGVPEKQLNPKKKIWEAVQPGFSTTENFEVTYTEEGKEPKRLVNERGELCHNTSIVKAEVK
ncbi:G4 quadruplex nucleic acid binding protein [Scheffersomyces stipitis CBS 6054]|uniref:G4 quadruplex nucleic acid binding protein n=1 Tax=Scheffersomyces stipitis (strain ATCC 58785 / CBS 6054 / NBRC 10063 / NRRL Y-11545) TaxID=322104 RepID=A3LQV6_PICST|nr:G4 quadruplex nucleic acid binding protein [Scheffersomyces stipitis CBS 6054]ABN65629.1 G4 quadruplex nucleic acid binding protein [Scheffersomyces stipitis CBS 6054]